MLKELFKFLSGRKSLSPEEREELVSKAYLYATGSIFLSDPHNPYAVAGAFVRKAMSDDGVAHPSALQDAPLVALRNVMIACLGNDKEHKAALRKALARQKPILGKVRAMTAPGRAAMQDKSAIKSSRSADAVIGMYGLKPTNPIRMFDQSSPSATQTARGT